jgi:hypothetical protein
VPSFTYVFLHVADPLYSILLQPPLQSFVCLFLELSFHKRKWSSTKRDVFPNFKQWRCCVPDVTVLQQSSTILSAIISTSGSSPQAGTGNAAPSVAPGLSPTRRSVGSPRSSVFVFANQMTNDASSSLVYAALSLQSLTAGGADAPHFSIRWTGLLLLVSLSCRSAFVLASL